MQQFRNPINSGPDISLKCKKSGSDLNHSTGKFTFQQFEQINEDVALSGKV